MPPTLWIEHRTERSVACDECGGWFPTVSGLVRSSDGSLDAAYAASGHTDEPREAALDVTFGAVEGDVPAPELLTFSCYLRADGAMSVDAPVALRADAGHAPRGRVLTRDEARAHPRIDDFWLIVDAIAPNEPVIHHAVHGRSLLSRLRWRLGSSS